MCACVFHASFCLCAASVHVCVCMRMCVCVCVQHFDGGSRGNPGVGGSGAVITDIKTKAKVCGIALSC